MRTIVLASVVLVLSSAVFPGASQQGGPARTVLDGVYTQTQAERGLRSYSEHCSRCHRDNLRGNPEALGLTGTRFIEAWREDTLFSLFEHMATRMPREPRQKLPDPVYVDILAFVLQFNGYPSGEQELTTEGLRRIYLVDHSGPQPLPNLALVRVVGCLTPGAKQTWALTRASNPARARDGVTTTPEELRTSAEDALGATTFPLQNLDYLDGVRPEAFSGHKVQVKGALIRRQDDQRISVTALETVASTCP